MGIFKILDPVVLTALVAEGKSAREIAKIFSVSSPTVLAHLRKHGLRTKRSLGPLVNLEKLQELVSQGKTRADLIREFNCGERTLSASISAAGLIVKRKARANAESILLENFKKLKAEGVLNHAIARELGICPERVSKLNVKASMESWTPKPTRSSRPKAEKVPQLKLEKIPKLKPEKIPKPKRIPFWQLALADNAEEYRRLVEEGRGIKEMAKLLSLSKEAVSRGLAHLGLQTAGQRKHRSTRQTRPVQGRFKTVTNADMARFEKAAHYFAIKFCNSMNVRNPHKDEAMNLLAWTVEDVTQAMRIQICEAIVKYNPEQSSDGHSEKMTLAKYVIVTLEWYVKTLQSPVMARKRGQQFPHIMGNQADRLFYGTNPDTF